MPELTKIPSRVLVGPTAVGKTDIAHAIARITGAGIISADAMMVYRGMDIGTAKPTESERAGLRYSGIDLVDPDRSFSVHDYLLRVDGQMNGDAESWLIAGGTGLYVRCLLCGLDEGSGPAHDVRREAETQLDVNGLDGLKAWCREKCPGIEEQLAEGDRDNPRRWIRAVERGRDSSSRRMRKMPEGTRIVGLTRGRTDLEARIIDRVGAMYSDGLLDEVDTLRRTFPALSETAAQAIGYAEAGAVIDGNMTVDKARERTVIRTRQYAKRQMTWFRNQMETQWIEIDDSDSAESVAEKVLHLWGAHG